MCIHVSGNLVTTRKVIRKQGVVQDGKTLENLYVRINCKDLMDTEVAKQTNKNPQDKLLVRKTTE